MQIYTAEIKKLRQKSAVKYDVLYVIDGWQ